MTAAGKHRLRRTRAIIATRIIVVAAVSRRSFFSGFTPRVFAHRGGAALGPENTMAAFDHAVELGADGLELDVRLSLDGQVVVHHDATLGRTTPLSGPVSQRTARELRAAGVSTLGDVLARHPGVLV